MYGTAQWRFRSEALAVLTVRMATAVIERAYRTLCAELYHHLHGPLPWPSVFDVSSSSDQTDGTVRSIYLTLLFLWPLASIIWPFLVVNLVTLEGAWAGRSGFLIRG